MRCQRREQLFIGLILGLLAAVSTVSLPATADGDEPAAEKPSLTSQAIDLINHDRAENRQAPLQQNEQLARVAQTYADYLLRTGNFGHVDAFGRNPQDRAAYLGVKVQVAENLAWESSDFEEPLVLLKRAQAGMMDEPRNQRNHRWNILNPQHRFVGVGVACNAEKVVLVQEFSGARP